MTTTPSGNPFAGTQVNAPILNPAQSFVTIPTSASTALSAANAVRGIYVVGNGNLVVKLLDGTTNAGKPIAVTVTGQRGQPIPMMVIQTTASNTATVLGYR